MDYKVVKKTEVPPKYNTRTGGKWRTIFDAIEFDEAITIKVKSPEVARAIAGSVSQTIRGSIADYKTHYRVASQDQGYVLYLWKEKFEKKPELRRNDETEL